MIMAEVAIGGRQWSVWVAQTSSELVAGLSGVANMPSWTGMLFDLGTERRVTVNAYKMLFPLSVVFIGEDLVVTEVVPLLSIGHDVTSVVPCRYFLEVNVGEADVIDPGDGMVITGYTPSASGSIIELVATVMIVAMMMQMMVKAIREVG